MLIELPTRACSQKQEIFAYAPPRRISLSSALANAPELRLTTERTI
jgi:hypothetical protein